LSHAKELLALAEQHDLSSNAAKRRCISTAYYAIFHRVIECIVQRFTPGDNLHAQNMARRALAHTVLKNICYKLAPKPGQPPGRPVAIPVSWADAGYRDSEHVDEKLSSLASKISEAHYWREQADYDLQRAVTEYEAEQQIERAREVFAKIEEGPQEPQWTLFLASLMFDGRK
jgi:uncharacterized protein (UPF0332 family)